MVKAVMLEIVVVIIILLLIAILRLIIVIAIIMGAANGGGFPLTGVVCMCASKQRRQPWLLRSYTRSMVRFRAWRVWVLCLGFWGLGFGGLRGSGLRT